MEVWRCGNCGRILAEVEAVGYIRVKCGCNTYNVYNVQQRRNGHDMPFYVSETIVSRSTGRLFDG